MRIGTAIHPDEGRDGLPPFKIHGCNAIYVEVPIKERALTEAEAEWCEDTLVYSGQQPRGQVVRDAPRLVITEIEDFPTPPRLSGCVVP